MQYLRRKLLALSGLTVAHMAVHAFPDLGKMQGSHAKSGVGEKGVPVHDGVERVVSLGGGITEIVYALGAGDKLVGVDSSSLYPEAARALPQVGYYRDVPVEGVAALRPSLVLASDQSGPDSALERLQALGMKVEILPDQPALSALKARIQRAAVLLHCEQTGQALLSKLTSELAQVTHADQPTASTPRVLSVMAHTATLLMAGSDTAADATLKLAGLHNVMGAQHGYKPVSAEAVIAAAPDLLVTTTLTVKAQGGLEKMMALPALAATPAGRLHNIVVMDDDLFLTFGPRLPQAVAMLRKAAASLSANT